MGTIHCKDTPDGKRYRIWSSVVDAYCTEPLTKDQMTAHLLRKLGERPSATLRSAWNAPRQPERVGIAKSASSPTIGKRSAVRRAVRSTMPSISPKSTGAARCVVSPRTTSAIVSPARL